MFIVQGMSFELLYYILRLSYHIANIGKSIQLNSYIYTFALKLPFLPTGIWNKITLPFGNYHHE